MKFVLSLLYFARKYCGIQEERAIGPIIAMCAYRFLFICKKGMSDCNDACQAPGPER